MDSVVMRALGAMHLPGALHLMGVCDPVPPVVTTWGALVH